MAGRTHAQDSYRFGFNGKENDSETGTQNFGARIFDNNLGRWFSKDPLQAKFAGYAPYVFVNNSPLIFIDPNGKVLKISIEDRQAILDLYSLAPTFTSRIQISSNGTVSIDLTAATGDPLIIGSDGEYLDKGFQLLVNLTSADEKYFYSTGSSFEGSRGGTFNLEQESDPVYGMMNKSTTPRYPLTKESFDDGTWLKQQGDNMPIIDGESYDGVVAINSKAIYYENGEVKNRAAVVFHELDESYGRTTLKMPYRVPEFLPAEPEHIDKAGYIIPKGYRKANIGLLDAVWQEGSFPNQSAHDRAIQREEGFSQKSKVHGGIDGGKKVKDSGKPLFSN